MVFVFEDIFIRIYLSCFKGANGGGGPSSWVHQQLISSDVMQKWAKAEGGREEHGADELKLHLPTNNTAMVISQRL